MLLSDINSFLGNPEGLYILSTAGLVLAGLGAVYGTFLLTRAAYRPLADRDGPVSRDAAEGDVDRDLPPPPAAEDVEAGGSDGNN